MTEAVLTSRRQVLKMLTSAPMLPLTGALASSTALLAACGGGAALESVSFSSMAAPSLADAAAMATTTVGSVMTTTFSDGTSTDFQLAYEPLFMTGDEVANLNGGSIVAGSYFDIHGKPIVDTTGPSGARQYFSDSPDGTSLLTVEHAKVHGVKGKPVFAVVQFEYTSLAADGATSMYGKLPSPIAVLTLDQDPKTGKLKLVKYHNVDTSSVNGLWITCGASLSPWGTHLSSEEYEPDAFTAASNSQFKAFIENLYGDATASADPAKANPYHYGHMPEVSVNRDGSGTIRKHYCMGRISHELVQMMPDARTALMGDDTTNGGLFVFVADRKNDLSSGSLYVAKVGAGFSIDPTQGAAALSWIKLGSASSKEIKRLAGSTLATDIFDRFVADPADASYTKIGVGGKFEWIKLKTGMEKAAAFLETHRYAAYLGASMGFTKMEGTTVNAADKVAYSALSACRDSMVLNNAKGNFPASGIAIPAALQAGAVMAMNLSGGSRDHTGALIKSDWIPVDTRALLIGEDLGAADSLGNTANPDAIANPDNLKYSETMRTLFIGEDSGMHVNNFLWAYNIDTRTLSRVMSTPAGAESTGLHAVDDINGWTYIMSNFQHPGDGLPSAVASTLDPMINANYKDKFGAAVGYLTANPQQPDLQHRQTGHEVGAHGSERTHKR
ncbi:PhoX family protein [Hydrogenophaga crassostreae]|uniref:Alkaline phosphatase n=1 Tax=Hydrogenophaga crassostreae TaxID=1763535 RepID=A0A1D8NXM4_9BURK|nr:alkaline phosphatase PhoX [Hydrogenophaga crassostreae]AOW13859.1 alkaline phosphatase [Hydrogenophaga crassostreae]